MNNIDYILQKARNIVSYYFEKLLMIPNEISIGNPRNFENINVLFHLLSILFQQFKEEIKMPQGSQVVNDLLLLLTLHFFHLTYA